MVGHLLQGMMSSWPLPVPLPISVRSQCINGAVSFKFLLLEHEPRPGRPGGYGARGTRKPFDTEGEGVLCLGKERRKGTVSLLG